MPISTSMSFCFCSVREENLASMLNGSITLDELRENRDNQYLDVKQASFEHYTEELIELLGEGHYALCDLLFLADNALRCMSSMTDYYMMWQLYLRLPKRLPRQT